MNIYLTELRAIDRATGGLKTFAGPRIAAPTWKLAEAECAVNYPYRFRSLARCGTFTQ